MGEHTHTWRDVANYGHKTSKIIEHLSKNSPTNYQAALWSFFLNPLESKVSYHSFTFVLYEPIRDTNGLHFPCADRDEFIFSWNTSVKPPAVSLGTGVGQDMVSPFLGMEAARSNYLQFLDSKSRSCRRRCVRWLTKQGLWWFHIA